MQRESPIDEPGWFPILTVVPVLRSTSRDDTVLDCIVDESVPGATQRDRGLPIAIRIEASPDHVTRVGDDVLLDRMIERSEVLQIGIVLRDREATLLVSAATRPGTWRGRFEHEDLGHLKRPRR